MIELQFVVNKQDKQQQYKWRKCLVVFLVLYSSFVLSTTSTFHFLSSLLSVIIIKSSTHYCKPINNPSKEIVEYEPFRSHIVRKLTISFFVMLLRIDWYRGSCLFDFLLQLILGSVNRLSEKVALTKQFFNNKPHFLVRPTINFVLFSRF